MNRHPLRLPAALAAAVAAACAQGGAPAAELEEAPVLVGQENIAIVAVTEVRSGPVISGSLEPEQAATVRAEVGGAVLATYAEEGQRVARGALLARLEDTALRDAYLSAQAAVRSAEQAAVVARRNAERAAALAEAGALAERELETARWNATAAEAQLADARSRLALAARQLAKTEIRAPVAGVVSRRAVAAGDVVQPGAELFTVVDPGSMRLAAAVPAEQLAGVRVGVPVEFRVSGYPGRVFAGRVSRVSPVADPATRQVRILVSIPNAAGALVGGLFAEGRVSTEARRAPTAPLDAVERNGAASVLRVRGGRVERVEVRLGLEDTQAQKVEILAGAAAGDTLLVGAARAIAPGTLVRVQAPAPEH